MIMILVTSTDLVPKFNGYYSVLPGSTVVVVVVPWHSGTERGRVNWFAIRWQTQ